MEDAVGMFLQRHGIALFSRYRGKYILLSISFWIYRKVSNIRRTLVGNKIVDHSDVVGASPVGAAPTTSSRLNIWLQGIQQRQPQDGTRIF